MSAPVKHLHRLLESANDLIQIVAAEGQLLYANAAWCKALGYSKLDIADLVFLELVHPVDRDRYLNLLAAPVEQDLTLDLLAGDGRTVTVQGRVSFDTDTAELWFLWHTIDERSQVEAALNQSEARYRAIVEAQATMVCRFRADGYLTFANEAYCEVFGISPATASYHRMFLLTINPDIEALLLSPLTSDRAVTTIERQIVLPSGDSRWQHWDSRPVFDTQGRFIEFQAIGWDVTERKQIEAALQQTTEQLNDILQSIDDVVWSYAPDTLTAFYISPAVETVYGYAVPDFYHNPNLWLEVVHPQDRPQVIAAMQDLHESGVLNLEYRIIRADGETRWLHERSRLIRDQRQRPIRVDSIIHDITDRKYTEGEILKSLKQERELNELKSRFVSMVSHEIRTPLTTIMTSADILQNLPCTREESTELFALIQESVRHMVQLLEDVLFIGLSESKRLEFNPVPLEPIAFCRDLIKELEMGIGQQHRLRLDLPQPSELSESVWLDRKLLRQLLINLVTNSVKYSAPGSEVWLKFTHDDNQAIFQIRDQGIGIPLDDQQRLFECFHRASNVGVINGTGLGLAIVKNCVDRHGGSIRVDSQVGVGTTFTVSLPAQQGEVSP